LGKASISWSWKAKPVLISDQFAEDVKRLPDDASGITGTIIPVDAGFLLT
jgi:hypothetical protein